MIGVKNEHRWDGHFENRDHVSRRCNIDRKEAQIIFETREKLFLKRKKNLREFSANSFRKNIKFHGNEKFLKREKEEMII